MGRKKDDGSEIAAYIVLFVIAAPIFLIWGLVKLIIMIWNATKEAKHKKQLKENKKVNKKEIDLSEKSIKNNNVNDNINNNTNNNINENLNINIEIDKLDIDTIRFISKILTDIEKKAKNIYSHSIKKIEINQITLEFLKDIETVKDINEIYTPIYYRDKIKKYFGDNEIILERMIKKQTLSATGKEIDTICNNMKKYTEIKLKSVYNQENNKNIYGICDELYLCAQYQVILDYLADVLTTCTCIAKIIFIDKKIREIEKNNEFFIIISNMTKEINDIELIFKKTKPLYDEFYKAELGNIKNNTLYKIFIKLIINRINDNETLLDEPKEKFENIQEFDEFMEKWITDFAKEYKNVDIYSYILIKIKNNIKSNDFNLFITALKQIYKYAGIYNYSVNYNEKLDIKERYLSGDFSKEKQEINEQYSLNNISTGTQFELYLTEIFKKLGYKTLHNGKAGDQGADIILKKGDYIYAIQAKFYTDRLSNTPIQEIVGALKYYNANQGVVITNSTFTKGAQDLAKANNVILIDGTGLKKLVNYVFDDEHEIDVLQNF